MCDDMEDLIESMLPDDWEYESGFGIDGLLICPHGHTIEQDGECPEGCVSPLRTMGLI